MIYDLAHKLTYWFWFSWGDGLTKQSTLEKFGLDSLGSLILKIFFKCFADNK